jgi:hypothetical protein
VPDAYYDKQELYVAIRRHQFFSFELDSENVTYDDALKNVSKIGMHKPANQKF